MTEPTKEDIKKVMSHLGSIKSKKKTRSSRRNVKIAQEARTSNEQCLENAYYLWKKGRMTKAEAHQEVACCRYSRFKEYCEKREAGLIPGRPVISPEDDDDE